MKNKEIDELLSDDLPMPTENISLDLNLIKENIVNYSNEKIAEMIVCDRYLGLEQKISAICMEELAKRRMAGDTFEFETYIEEAYKSLPVLDFSSSIDLRSILSQAINNKIK